MDVGLVDVGLVDVGLVDMDETLVDSDAAVERAWTVWANEYRVEPAVAMAIAHGSPAESTVGHLLPELDAEAIAVSAARQLELQYDDLCDVTASTGAHELLAVLARLAIPWPPRLSGPAGTSVGRHRSMMPVTRAASRAPLHNPALPNPGGLT